MATLTESAAISVEGVRKTIVNSVEGSALLSLDPTLAAAAEGVVSSTPNRLTMDSAGHGVELSDTVDIYWEDTSETECLRWNNDVDTVSGVTLVVSGGSGDALPAAATEITVAIREFFAAEFEGDDLKALAIGAPARGNLSFFAASSVVMHVPWTGGGGRTWLDVASGVTNPLAGQSIDGFIATQALAEAEDDFECAILYDPE